MQTNVDAAALASSLRRFSDQRRGTGSLRDSVRTVIDACVELFDVDGSGLMLADEQSVLRYAVATDGPGRMLEDLQLETGEGPCVDTFVHDERTVVADLAADARYPHVGPGLVSAGVVAVLGVPVRLSGIPVGSLDVYRSRPHEWDDSEQAALTRYGDVLEATIAAALAADQAGELAEQLNYALDYRVPIERGVGYLMARDGVDHAAAFNRLRNAARSTRRRIGDIAAELLDSGRLPDEPS
jgi:GAF domain-containing protein